MAVSRLIQLILLIQVTSPTAGRFAPAPLLPLVKQWLVAHGHGAALRVLYRQVQTSL